MAGAAELWMKPNITPEAPYANIGHQGVNAKYDVKLINRQISSPSERFYPGAPRSGIKVEPSQAAIEEYKMSDLMVAKNGALCFTLNEDRTNRRHQKMNLDPKNVCVPCFSTLAGLGRIDKPAGEGKPSNFRYDYEATMHEHSMTFLGIALAPGSDQDNDGQFLAMTAGNASIKMTGPYKVKAGQEFAFRVPRPYETQLGYFTDEKNPQAWIVPVDRAKWDLNQRAYFIQTALNQFSNEPNPLDPSKKIRLGAACVHAMFVDGAVASLAQRRAAARKLVEKHMKGMNEFDVAVVQLVLADVIHTPGNTPADTRTAIFDITGDEAELKSIFEHVALDLLPAVRNTVSATDHTKIGKAFTTADKGQSMFSRVGRIA